MALLLMGQVNDRAAALLDDPGHNRFSTNYLRAHIDQQNESMMTTLETLGVQQQETTAIIPNLPAGTWDLTPYFAPGQPLQYFLRPKRILWKPQGQPDTEYQTCFPANELDPVSPANQGNQNYTWRGGSLQVTKSSIPTTLWIDQLTLTATLFDSNAQVMRGIGYILAEMVAGFVAALNNGMGTLQKKLEKDLARDKRNFANLLVMQQQGTMIVARSVRRRVNTQISTGGTPLT